LPLLCVLLVCSWHFCEVPADAEYVRL
jgi:hypothetical protein